MSKRKGSIHQQGQFTRRQLLEGGGVAAVSGLLGGTAIGQVESPAIGEAAVYRRIGVRPLINCKGTFTIITGSLTLPRVKKAMDEASRHFVHLDELMEAVGGRLAELTGAEWGIVTAGCSAAQTLATCACVAGANPELLQQLPDLTGMKDEVIVPLYSRNVYDHAIRMLGVRIVTVKTIEELEAAFGPRTAMVYVLACPEDTGPLGLEPVARMARSHGIPVLVDAAAENLTPEVHLGRGADVVAYSGGKALRGPQCAGLLLGKKDLCQAAWLHSAPHHAFGRSMKVGKEEIMGMLGAVEAWYERDHEAEWELWESWLGTIAREVESVPGVSTRVIQPESLSNNAPRLRVEWPAERLGIGGEEVFNFLLDGDPRIILASGRTGETPDRNFVEVMPWMMQPGEDRIVGSRLRGILADPPPREKKATGGGTPAEVAGVWEAELKFLLGSDRHLLSFEQEGGRLKGIHHGNRLSGQLHGTVDGSRIEFSSSQPFEGTRIGFHFRGEVGPDRMGGTVNLEEYGEAEWVARRLQF